MLSFLKCHRECESFAMRVHVSLLFWALGCGLVVASCGSTKTGFDNSSSGSGGGSSGGSSGTGSGSSSGGITGSSSGGNNFGDGGFSDSGPPPIVGDPTTCADAAMGHTYVGCDYWPTVTANVVWSVFDFAVVVANAGMEMANVTVTGPGGVNQSATVPPAQLATIYLPWVPDLKGPDDTECGYTVSPLANSVLEKGGAYHLVSSVPVTVYQFSALEYKGQGGPSGKDWSSCPGTATQCKDPNVVGFNPQFIGCYSFTNDASLLLPSTAMTGNYRITGHEGISPPPANPFAPPDAAPPQGIANFAAITATADNTTVKVKVSSAGNVEASVSGDIAATSSNGTLTLTMNAGDVAQLMTAQADAADLSGSLVQANNPVQVITGTACTVIPQNAPACDHLEESNFPAETLGQDYIVVQPMGPNGNVVGHQVRIYGNVDGTNLTYSPSAPPNCPTTINAGQVVECGTTLNTCPDPLTGTPSSCGPGNIVSQDFEIKGDNAFAVATFSQGAAMVDPNTMPPNQQGDPDESVVAAVKQYRVKYVFLAPTDYAVNYAVVVAPTGTKIWIDTTQTTATPAPVGTSGYDAVRIPLATGNGGAHVLTASNPVGLQVMGYGSYTSYTYPGGLNLSLIAPPPPPIQ
jgi:hypothetical protein